MWWAENGSRCSQKSNAVQPSTSSFPFNILRVLSLSFWRWAVEFQTAAMLSWLSTLLDSRKIGFEAVASVHF